MNGTPQRRIDAIVVGGSSGALEALTVLLPALPRTSAAVALVIHLPPTRPSHLAAVLSAHTDLIVREAEDRERLEPGVVYVAPPNDHLLIERGGTFALSADKPVHFSRPAIDVLFQSAADAYRERLAGVVLSGANADGAEGLAAIKRAGGLTAVQAPDDALARAMPDAAVARAAPHHVLPLAGLASLLAQIAAPRKIEELR